MTNSRIYVDGHRCMAGSDIDRALLGDPFKVKTVLGWISEITTQDRCPAMVANDIAEAKQHALLKKHGYDV